MDRENLHHWNRNLILSYSQQNEMHFYTIFRLNLHQTKWLKQAFYIIVSIVFLSSIQCNPVEMLYLTNKMIRL